jgi:cytochrome P450
MVIEAWPFAGLYSGDMKDHDLETPRDPIAAVTHPDPYPYYAKLRTASPLYDDGLGLWVASSAPMVTAVLTHPASRVRPADAPVPKELLGSPAAEVFRHLVRMNDGSAHCPFKRAVTATLDGVDSAWLDATADDKAARLAADVDDPSRVADFADTLPAHVMGALLGLPEESLARVSAWTSDLVRCLFPGGSPDQVERGKTAARQLLGLVESTASTGGGHSSSLVRRLTDEARRIGRDDARLVAANAIGFLAQAHDATAALIGTTILTLARQPALRGRLDDALLDEVLRFDAPVQNTRRFLHDDAEIGGLRLPAGSAILVVLAAANRDPEANPNPDVIDPARPTARAFTFGVGPHACPGRRVATSIARAAVSSLLARGLDLGRVETRPAYRASANCRMPLLTWKENA